MKALNICPFCLCGVRCPPANHDDDDETNHFDYDPNFFECLYGLDCPNRFRFRLNDEGIYWFCFQMLRYHIQIYYKDSEKYHGTHIYGLNERGDISLESSIHIKTPFIPDFKNMQALQDKIKMLATFS